MPLTFKDTEYNEYCHCVKRRRCIAMYYCFICLSSCPPGTVTAQLRNFEHVKHQSLNGKGGLLRKLDQVLPF